MQWYIREGIAFSESLQPPKVSGSHVATIEWKKERALMQNVTSHLTGMFLTNCHVRSIDVCLMPEQSQCIG